MRAFAFVREALVEEEKEEGDVNCNRDAVEFESFVEDEIDTEVCEDGDEDQMLKNASIEEEIHNRASTSDDDDEESEQEEEEEEEREVIIKTNRKTSKENAKPFSLRVRLASSSGVPVTFRLPNVFENSIFNVTSSYNNDKQMEVKKKKKKSDKKLSNTNRIEIDDDDEITFKFWANPSKLATALSSPDALLKVQTLSSVSSVSMSGLLEKPTVKESFLIRDTKENVYLELTLSDLSSSFSSSHIDEEDEEQENFEPKPRPPLAREPETNRFPRPHSPNASEYSSTATKTTKGTIDYVFIYSSIRRRRPKYRGIQRRFRTRKLEARTHARLGKQVHRRSH